MVTRVDDTTVASSIIPCLQVLSLVIDKYRVLSHVNCLMLWRTVRDDSNLVDFGQIFLTPIGLCLGHAVLEAISVHHGQPRHDADVPAVVTKGINGSIEPVHVDARTGDCVWSRVIITNHVEPAVHVIEVGDGPVHVKIERVHADDSAFPYCVLLYLSLIVDCFSLCYVIIEDNKYGKYLGSFTENTYLDSTSINVLLISIPNHSAD